MRFQRLIVLGIFLLIPLTKPVGAEDETLSTEDMIDQLAIVDAGNQFALDLYAVLRGDHENLVLCPHSLVTTLTMTYLGARGTTAREHERALHLEVFERDALRAVDAQAALQYALREAAKGGPVKFSTDSMAWGQARMDFNQTYLDGLRLSKLGGFEALDFHRDPEAAVNRINRWAERRTGGRIKSLIDPDSLHAPVLLVLTNVVYFKGAWQTPFEPEDTAAQPFRVSQTETPDVPMMNLTHTVRYFETETVQILELPYAPKARNDSTSGGGGFVMDVVLPKQPGGLEAVEKKLKLGELKQWLAGLRPQRVAVSLPRFTFRTRSDLSSAAPALGLSDMFAPSRADFSGLWGERGDLWVSMLIHESVIEVTEQGTEAAGGSGVGLSGTSIPPEPIVFRADQPFLFLIRDCETGASLFIGRVSHPDQVPAADST